MNRWPAERTEARSPRRARGRRGTGAGRDDGGRRRRAGGRRSGAADAPVGRAARGPRPRHSGVAVPGAGDRRRASRLLAARHRRQAALAEGVCRRQGAGRGVREQPLPRVDRLRAARSRPARQIPEAGRARRRHQSQQSQGRAPERAGIHGHERLVRGDEGPRRVHADGVALPVRRRDAGGVEVVRRRGDAAHLRVRPGPQAALPGRHRRQPGGGAGQAALRGRCDRRGARRTSGCGDRVARARLHHQVAREVSGRRRAGDEDDSVEPRSR